jgi:DNA repair protein RecN (Recombination protein N)
VLDNYAGNREALIEYQGIFNAYTGKVQELDRLKARKASIKAEEDFIRFQYDELERSALQEDELIYLEEEQEILANAEEIKSKLYETLSSLQQSDDSILDRMAGIMSLTRTIADYHKEIKELHERLQSTEIELNDIASTLSGLEEDINYDPARLESLSQRLDLIYGLMQKHKVQDITSLIRIRDEFSLKLNDIENIDEDIENIQRQADGLRKKLEQKAMQLNKNRSAGIPGLEKEITTALRQLGMEKAILNVKLDSISTFAEYGKDQVEFLFSANPGSAPAAVSKIASGGEMSRIMLAIKSMITRKNLLPTVILDEIDMGVSGEVASRVGKMLSEMSKHMQLIAITHLPQIAGKAYQHFKVYKQYSGDHTETLMKKLNDEERVEEIAAMMSNESVSMAAKETAKELLQKN